jgi:dihydrofolate synthase / folylpolyglutamate synthase
MDFKETLEYLYSQLPAFHRIGKAAYKANLDNTKALDDYFCSPHRKYKTIHIAGTNGKGSVSHMIASVLQQAGYKTGLYTSPHLKDFRERIKINGKEIPEQKVVEFVQRHKHFFEPMKPSFFELTVAMAFDYFANEEIEVAIIETGMGGRLDSTNIIIPELSVITNISNDHSQFLGDTLDKIAGEKAGIIKKGIPVVIGENQKPTNQVFIDKAKVEGSLLYFADQNFHADKEIIRDGFTQTFQIYKEGQLVYPDLKIDLNGIYQKKNLLTAIQSIEILEQLGFGISKRAVYSGMENVAASTGLKGRWQILGRQPLIICDTGHNEAGIREILEHIKLLKYDNLHMVIGFVEDKNIDSLLEMLPVKATYYFCRADLPRALDQKLLKEKAALFGLEGKSYLSVELALQAAKDRADEDDLVFVGGSTFVVAEVC